MKPDNPYVEQASIVALNIAQSIKSNKLEWHRDLLQETLSRYGDDESESELIPCVCVVYFLSQYRLKGARDRLPSPFFRQLLAELVEAFHNLQQYFFIHTHTHINTTITHPVASTLFLETR